MEENKTINMRVEYIDIARAIAMFLVLWGHTVDSNTLYKNIVYAFHMPLFYMISGMVITPKEEWFANWKAILIKKFKTIMVPYLIWGLVYSPFSFKNLLFILYGARESLICANSLTSLWFLPTLMISSVISELIINLMEKYKRKYIFIVLVIFICASIGFIMPHYEKYGNPWGIDIAFIATAFMLLGYLLRVILDRSGKLKITYILFGLGIFVLIFVVCVQYSSTSVGYVLMANGIYGNPITFFINAISGSLVVVGIAQIFSKGKLMKKILCGIGKNTIGIFILHKPFVEMGRTIVNLLGADYNEIVFTSLIVVVSMTIVYIIVQIINHVIPQLLGKKL